MCHFIHCTAEEGRKPINHTDVLPFVSVIVCVYNGANHVERCLRSLLAQTQTRDRFEIIVIDDGSTDNTSELVKNIGAEIRLIHLHKNSGLAVARNMGVKMARGDIICFTDVDCVADPDWVAKITNFFASRTDVHAIGGSVVPTSGKTLWELWYEYTPTTAGCHQPLCRGDDTSKLLRILGVARGRLPIDGEELSVIQGANSSFRSDVIVALGGWHPAIRFGGDDVELSNRIMAAGFKQVYLASAIVYHYHRSTAKAFMRHAFVYGRGGGRLRYLQQQNNLRSVLSFWSRFLPFVILYALTQNLMCFLLAPLAFLVVTLPRSWPFARLKKKPWLVLGLPLADFLWHFLHWLGLVTSIVEWRRSEHSQFWQDVGLNR